MYGGDRKVVVAGAWNLSIRTWKSCCFSSKITTNSLEFQV